MQEKFVLKEQPLCLAVNNLFLVNNNIYTSFNELACTMYFSLICRE